MQYKFLLTIAGIITTVVILPLGIIKTLYRRVVYNVPPYLEFIITLRNCPNFEATNYWDLEQELIENNIHIVHGEYRITDNQVVVQVQNPELIKNREKLESTIKDSFLASNYEVENIVEET